MTHSDWKLVFCAIADAIVPEEPHPDGRPSKELSSPDHAWTAWRVRQRIRNYLLDEAARAEAGGVE